MKNIIYKVVLKMNRKKIIITTAILINMLMCSCGSESNNIGDSELKAETIADNEVAESEIITKEIAEESIKSITVSYTHLDVYKRQIYISTS